MIDSLRFWWFMGIHDYCQHKLWTDMILRGFQDRDLLHISTKSRPDVKMLDIMLGMAGKVMRHLYFQLSIQCNISIHILLLKTISIDFPLQIPSETAKESERSKINDSFQWQNTRLNHPKTSASWYSIKIILKNTSLTPNTILCDKPNTYGLSWTEVRRLLFFRSCSASLHIQVVQVRQVITLNPDV